MSEPFSRYTGHLPVADKIISVVTIGAPNPAHNRSQCPMR